MTDKTPYDCYLLVEMTDPAAALLYSEKYVILLREDGSVSVPYGQHEVLEEGKNASAAEWIRLHKICEELRQVSEVMES